MKTTYSLQVFLITLFCLTATSFLYAQNIKITGMVTTNDNQPVPYSSITLTNTEDQKKIFGGLADEKGKFSIEITPGEYDITVDQAGFESYFDQRTLQEDTFLGKLTMEPAGKTKEKELEGVVIQGSRPVYKMELDKKVYDVTQDLTAKGGTLSDVMQNVPSVSVDVDGTVSLRGNDNVKILIDGKPSAMLGINDIGDALKMISADMVEKIEVVTNASTRYEAAGTAGIINIITKKNRKPGIAGSIEILGGSPQLYGTNLNLSFGKKNWSWFANAGFRYSKAEGKNSTNYSRFDDSGDLIQHTLQDGTRERENTSFNLNTGFNFNFDKYNSLTTSIGYRLSNRNSLNITNYDDNIYNDILDEFVNYKSQRQERQRNDGFGLDANLNFTHNFLKKDNTLTIDGNFNYTVDDSDSDITDTTLGKSLNYNTRTGFMMKSDYVLPFKEGSQFEAGVRTDYNKIKSDYSLNQLDSTGVWKINPNYTDQSNYEENILAAYMQYGNKFGNFSFLAGLREETSFIKVQSASQNSTVNKHYTDLFPSLHLNYNISEKSQFQLSYSRRIDRPQGRMLVSYKNQSDDRNTFQGNPDLNPAYTDSYELGVNVQYRTWGITPSVYYQRTNDAFQMVVTRQPDESLNTQPVNMGHENRYGGELSYTFSPYKWWKIFGEFNFYQYENFADAAHQDLNRSGFSWNTRLNTTLKLPDLFNFQLQANYMAPRESGQNKMKEMFGMNLGLSKDVLKGRGTLLFNVQDVFNSRKRKVETFGDDFYRYSEMQWRPRQFTLTFTYRFTKEPQKNDRKNKQQRQNNGSDFDDMEMGG